MRARNIKPGLFKNELLAAADPLHTIVFAGLWCMADREGRLEDKPFKIHLEVNPARSYESTVQSIAWLVANHFLVRYEAGGQKYIAVLEFKKHQQPHTREAKSAIPPPPNQQVSQGDAEAQPRQCSARLIPDSGFSDSLIPDSGLRIPDSSAHDEGSAKASPRTVDPAPRGTSDAHEVWRGHHNWFLETIRPVYPSALHSDAEWHTTARTVAGWLTEGKTNREELLGLTNDFAAQQDAFGNRDKQFVAKPSKHFSWQGEWRGPFKLPASGIKAEESAMDRIVRLNKAGANG